MEWYSIDTWIVVIAALAAVACALPGNFIVLRKMNMMVDAIIHAELPGLAIAFLVTGARASLSMFIGAAVAGGRQPSLQWISRFGKVDEGASMESSLRRFLPSRAHHCKVPTMSTSIQVACFMVRSS